MSTDITRETAGAGRRLPASAHGADPSANSGAVPARRGAARTARRRSLKRALAFLAPVVVAGAGFAGYQGLVKSRVEPAALRAAEKAWPVQVAAIHPAPRTPSLTLFGRIESPRLARISAAIQADVLQMRAVEGELVDAGAVLVVLDPRDAHLTLRQRESEVADIRAQIALERERNRQDRESLGKERELMELARRELERAEDLAKRGLDSQSRLDQARERAARQELAVLARESAARGHESRLARLEAQRVRAETARDRAVLDVERTRVTAPFHGRIAEIFAAQGDRVRTGDRLLSVFDVSRLEVRAQIPSRHLVQVEGSRGREAYFEVEGRRYAAPLSRLGGQVLPGRGGVDALFRIDGAGQDLRIGRTVELTFELAPRPDAVWLPFEALHGAARVFKVRENRLAGIRVRRIGEARGADGREGVLVTSPELASGDRIVVNQLANAVEGLRVEPVPTPGANLSRDRRPGLQDTRE